MTVPSEAISISGDSTEEDASVGGTERSIASVHQNPAALADDVLPSIEEVPESDKIDNQVMEFVLKRRPDLTRGEVLFFALPLEVRLRIYTYHQIHHRSAYAAQPDKSRRIPPSPLSQTCRTFWRETRGYALAQLAVVKSEEDFKKFVKCCRLQGLSPFLNALAFNLAWPESQLGALDNIRCVLQTASVEFKYISNLTFYIQSARDSTFGVLRQLMHDGTLARFTSLEIVHAKDNRIKERYNTRCNQEARAVIDTKMREWAAAGKIQRDINTEVLGVARCMMRLRILNTEFIAMVRWWRRDKRDSAVHVGREQVESSTPLPPRGDTTVSVDDP